MLIFSYLHENLLPFIFITNRKFDIFILQKQRQKLDDNTKKSCWKYSNLSNALKGEFDKNGSNLKLFTNLWSFMHPATQSSPQNQKRNFKFFLCFQIIINLKNGIVYQNISVIILKCRWLLHWYTNFRSKMPSIRILTDSH